MLVYPHPRCLEIPSVIKVVYLDCLARRRPGTPSAPSDIEGVCLTGGEAFDPYRFSDSHGNTRDLSIHGIAANLPHSSRLFWIYFKKAGALEKADEEEQGYDYPYYDEDFFLFLTGKTQALRFPASRAPLFSGCRCPSGACSSSSRFSGTCPSGAWPPWQ